MIFWIVYGFQQVNFSEWVCSTQGGIDLGFGFPHLCAMYFKVSMRRNPDNGNYQG